MLNPARRTTAGLAGLLILTGVALHAPRIAEPFRATEAAAGTRFGVYAQAFAQRGWTKLRGAPLVATRFMNPRASVVHFDDAPGGVWLHAALGTKEWQIRLPGLAAWITAAIAVMLLLRPRLGTLRAMAGGFMILAAEPWAHDAWSSPVAAALAAGLLALVLADRIGRADAGKRVGLALGSLAAVVFVGSWIHWLSWALWPAMLPVLPWRNRRRVAFILVAVIAAWGTATFCIHLWQQWAMKGPALDPTGAQFTTFRWLSLLGGPTSWKTFFDQFLAVIDGSLTTPALVVGAAGLGVLAFGQARLTGALALFAVLPALALPEGLAHRVSTAAALTPLLAASVAAFRTPRFIDARVICGPAIVAAVLTSLFGMFRTLDTTNTTFFRDLGAVIDRETNRASPARPEITHWYVAHPPAVTPYTYYTESPFVVTGSQVAAAITTATAANLGIRYLDFVAPETASKRNDPIRLTLTSKGQAPRRRVPEMEQPLHGFPRGATLLDVAECWVYDTPP